MKRKLQRQGTSIVTSIVICGIFLAILSGSAFPQTELIANGTFQFGSTGWVRSGNFFADSRFGTCRSCPGYAYLSNPDGTSGDNLLGNIYQTVTIPSSANSATLSFWYNITSQETGPTAYDVLNVTVQNNTGGFLATVAVLSNLDKGTLGVYSQRTFDMTPFKGQTVRINFLGTTDSSLPTTFRVDDVSLITTSAAPAAPSGLLAAALSSSQISLAWTDNSNNETGFKVERKVGTGGTFSQIGTQGANLNFFNDSGLSAATQYCYRVRATNSTGDSAYSNESCATTSSPPVIAPTATTGTCQVNSPSSALLFGTVNPNGSSTTAWFQWGTSTAYGNETTHQNIGAGTSVEQVTHQISGLSANTTYHFRMVGQNNGGTSNGADLTCTTPPPAVNPPTVTTDPATSVGSSSATLNGTVNPNGAPATGWFEWGTSTAYSNSTPPLSAGSGTSPVPMNISVSGLSPNTTYHFRAVGHNSAGTTYGPDRTFTTSVLLAPSISSVSPSPVTGSDIPQLFTIHGSNFVSGATVTLRDLRTGQVFPNRGISSFSSTQIVILPIFATTAANWSVEVINPGQVSSGQFSFDVVVPDRDIVIEDLARVYRVSRDKSSYLLQVRWLTAVGLYDLRTASNA